MRFRDKIFEEDWEIVKPSTTLTRLLALSHHLFGIISIALIVIQSAISLNVFLFTLWTMIGVVILIIDIMGGTSIKLSNEIIFLLIIIFATIISLILGDYNSMFFPIQINGRDIRIYQIGAGVFVSLRIICTFIYVERSSQNKYTYRPSSSYTEEQVSEYKANLTKTDFEFTIPKIPSFLTKIRFFLEGLPVSLLIIGIFALLGIGYVGLIYLITPTNTIREFNVFPAFIIIGILFVLLLFRLASIAPKISSEKDSN